MVTVYIHINQLNNFLINKEPITLISMPTNENFIECMFNSKDLIFTEYNTYVTVELKTIKKILKLKWRNLWEKNKLRKNKKK